MLKGSVWMVALRWAIRLTGVISTVILARLLNPQDFGVVAIAMIVVGMFEMLSLTGQGLAIIRHGDPTREHYDTAWTISVLIGFGIAVAICAVAPFTKIYFHDDRSVIVMQCLSLRALLGGFENIGLVNFQRDLNFGRVFSYNLYAKLISFLTTMVLAFLLRNYWALVAGILVGQLARTVLSYGMHPYRPRVCFTKMNEIWSFSIWSFARSIGSYFIGQMDIIAIGGVAGAASMGRYTVANDVASSPTNELNDPVLAVLFPVMAKYQHDPEQMRRLYLRTLGWAALIGVSTSTGVMMVAPDMVSVVLGAKWVTITPLIGWLALTAGASTLTNSGFILLDVVGLPHVGARMQWVRVVLLALVVFPVAFLTRDLVSVAMARFVMALLILPSFLIAIGRRIDVSLQNYGSVLWRPVAAGCIMALCIWSVNFVLPFHGPWRLVIDIGVGIASFVASLLWLWTISGRPPSAERDVIGLMQRIQSGFIAIRARLSGMGQ
jgi:O-antigen/teichoic acid export membrane protein